MLTGMKLTGWFHIQLLDSSKIIAVQDKGSIDGKLARLVEGISSLKVAVNVSRGEQTFPQIMADFSLFVH